MFLGHSWSTDLKIILELSLVGTYVKLYFSNVIRDRFIKSYFETILIEKTCVNYLRHTSLKRDTLLKCTYIKYEYNVRSPYTFLPDCSPTSKKKNLSNLVQLWYFSGEQPGNNSLDGGDYERLKIRIQGAALTERRGNFIICFVFILFFTFSWRFILIIWYLYEVFEFIMKFECLWSRMKNLFKTVGSLRMRKRFVGIHNTEIPKAL